MTLRGTRTAPVVTGADWSQLETETGDGLFDPPEAVFDRPRRRYRYRLTRTWSAASPLVVLMLNPSTADAFADDPTIVRVTGFAKREGYGGIIVVNLFAWRATKPAALRSCPDPVGPLNDAFILQEATTPGRDVLAAWGAHGSLNGRAAQVLAMLGRAAVPLLCLGRTKGGEPPHPLMLRADTPFTTFDPAA